MVSAAILAPTAHSIASPGQDISTSAKASKCDHVTAKAFRPFSHHVWRLPAWDRGDPPRRVIRAQRAKLACAAGPDHLASMRRTWRADRRAFYRHRQTKRAQQRRLRYLPESCGGGVRSAIPCYIMLCESGGDYRAKNPVSSAGGKYQIIDSTWYAYGGAYYPGSHPAAEAPPEEQDRIATAILHDSGASAWECS